MGMQIFHNIVAPGLATVTTADLTKGVYCGVAGDYDFYIKGAWVLMKGMLAGHIYPLQVTGVRDADDTDVEAGDIMFLY